VGELGIEEAIYKVDWYGKVKKQVSGCDVLEKR
jgi:hypothetical protein